MRLHGCLLFAFMFVAVEPGSALADQPAGILQSETSYGPDPQQKLDICLPSPKPTKHLPALIMIHGGAWRMGSRHDWGDICEIAAASGLAAVTIDYRLADGTPQHAWPAQLIDAQLAVRWVRANADRYGIDPMHVCAIGDSAGGHLTVFLAALDRITPGDYADQWSDVSPKINCGIDWFGAVDLMGDAARYPNLAKSLFANVKAGAYGEAEQSASPLFRVDAATAPMLIVQGTTDAQVDISQSRRLQQALNSAGIPNQLWIYEGGHEFAGAKKKILGFVQASIAFTKDPIGFLRDRRPPPISP
jgi:acetyl esterase/lipase